MIHKRKIDELDLIKILKFLFHNDTVKENEKSNYSLVENICKLYIQLASRDENSTWLLVSFWRLNEQVKSLV